LPRATRPSEAWTANDVLELLSNPLYVGFGHVPRIVDDQVWIAAQVRLVAEIGAASLLQRIQQHLLAQFQSVSTVASPDWIAQAEQMIASDGAEAFFPQLLSRLRTQLGRPPGETPAA
jgi:hypothetical protein